MTKNIVGFKCIGAINPFYDSLNAIDSIPHNTSLKYIDLSRCDLSLYDFLSVMAVLSGAKALTHINMSNNKITGDRNDICYNAIKSLYNLTIFNLKNNPLHEFRVKKWREANPLVELIF